MRTTCWSPVIAGILAASCASAQVTISITPQANQPAKPQVGLPFSADVTIHTVRRLAAESPPLPEPGPAEARDAFVATLGAGRPAIAVLEALDLAGLS